MTSSETAAWIAAGAALASAVAAICQAVFSVLAIKSAVRIAERQEKIADENLRQAEQERQAREREALDREKKASADRARGFAVTLSLELEKWKEDYQRWIWAFESGDATAKWLAVKQLAEDKIGLKSPPLLEDASRHFADYGIACEPLQQLWIARTTLLNARSRFKDHVDHKIRGQMLSGELEDQDLSLVKGFVDALVTACSSLDKVKAS